MRSYCFFFSLSVFLFEVTVPQGDINGQMIEHPSIHQIEHASHVGDVSNQAAFLKPVISTPPLAKRSRSLSRQVFGFHPYWVNSTYTSLYKYELLSTVGYFSYDVEPISGGYTSIHSWLTTDLVDRAHSRGTKCVLAVVNFGYDKNKTLLSNPQARTNLINNLAGLVKARNADGVNIDFESVGSDQRANLVSFMRDLAVRMRAEIPDAQITMDAPAVDWGGGWDVSALSQIIDYFFVMCYDFYWSGSTTAGPVAPLMGGTYNTVSSISWYLYNGAPPSKIILGVPYYGYDWPTKDSTRQSIATGTGSSRLYAVAKDASSGCGKKWDTIYSTPWYAYQVGGGWRECWFDDSVSLALKYDFAKARDLGGVGMWALSYDGNYPELWNLLETEFTSPRTLVESQRGSMRFRLVQNYPNPFNPSTTIRYQIPSTRFVILRVYDALGREVETLVDGMKNRGEYSVEFGAKGLSSGVYFCRLTATDGSETLTHVQRMTLLR
jgi:spore germination protein YaaH